MINYFLPKLKSFTEELKANYGNVTFKVIFHLGHVIS